MIRKFIKEECSYSFEKFEKACLEAFDKGWIPSISQPTIATTSSIFVLLVEKEINKENKKEF